MQGKILRNYFFQRFFDTLISIALICILVTVYIEASLPFINLARTTHFAGTPFFNARMEAMLYHARHGVWPENNQQAANRLLAGIGDAAGDRSGVATVIHDGAIDFIFKKRLDGKRMTLRPAVPAGDPLGPVCWVNTRGRIPEGWTVFGEDRTDLDKRFIHRALDF